MSGAHAELELTLLEPQSHHQVVSAAAMYAQVQVGAGVDVLRSAGRHDREDSGQLGLRRLISVLVTASFTGLIEDPGD